MAIKGLKAIKEKVAEKAFTGDGESPFIKLQDGDSFKIRFLQELDDESENYDERRGAIEVVEEHVSPKNFRLRAVCTAESEGRCWACEQTAIPDKDIAKKWKPKLRFYANVLVRNPEGEDKVKILAQGFGDKATGTTLVESAEEFGAVGINDFKISRKGKGMNDTSYSLLPLAPKPLSKTDLAHEVIDLHKFIKTVPYSDQPAFYSGESVEEKGGNSSDW